MRKEHLFAFAAFFFISLSAMTAVFAMEEAEKTVIILERFIDVTGDGKPEELTLKGIQNQKDNPFMKNIFLEVVNSRDEKVRINAGTGIEPGISFADLNHDGILDVLINVSTGGSGEVSNYLLYTFKDFKPTDLSVPEVLNIDTSFQDGYQAKAVIKPTSDVFTFDLKNRKQEYDQSGLYLNGKLNEPTELIVQRFTSLTPVMIEGNQLGLKGVQLISGITTSDSIAKVESSWFYSDGQWKLKRTKVYTLKAH